MDITLSWAMDITLARHSGDAGNLHTVNDGRIDIRRVTKAFGASPVLRGVSVDAPAEQTLVLLGPSGCGKTTLLRSIVGLEPIDDGEILLDGEALSGPGVHVRPEHRRIGMVFQDWALFPHLSVAQNVGYGLSRAERRTGRVDESLALVGLDGLGDRMPATLSGGQQQRVALARALAPRPSALLFDEPFSNLDTALRVQVRSEIHRVLTELGITTIFVTHDQEEAFLLGDRVAVMQEGCIEQHDSPAVIYEQPASRWVAQFVGEANFIPGSGHGGHAETALGTVPLSVPLTGPAEVLVRPEHIALELGDAALVELVEYHGHDHSVIIVDRAGTRLRVRRPGVPRHARGDRVDARLLGSPTVAFESTANPSNGEREQPLGVPPPR